MGNRLPPTAVTPQKPLRSAGSLQPRYHELTKRLLASNRRHDNMSAGSCPPAWHDLVGDGPVRSRFALAVRTSAAMLRALREHLAAFGQNESMHNNALLVGCVRKRTTGFGQSLPGPGDWLVCDGVSMLTQSREHGTRRCVRPKTVVWSGACDTTEQSAPADRGHSYSWKSSIVCRPPRLMSRVVA